MPGRYTYLGGPRNRLRPTYAKNHCFPSPPYLTS